MPRKSTQPRSRRTSGLVVKSDLLELLNDDFTRECRAIYGYAVFAERMKPRPVAKEIERRGHATVRSALVLCQIIYDYGGTVNHQFDELNAVLNADRVSEQSWEDETIRRLTERARQLAVAGEPGLAKRVRRLITAKRSGRALHELVMDSSAETKTAPKRLGAVKRN